MHLRRRCRPRVGEVPRCRRRSGFYLNDLYSFHSHDLTNWFADRRIYFLPASLCMSSVSLSLRSFSFRHRSLVLRLITFLRLHVLYPAIFLLGNAPRLNTLLRSSFPLVVQPRENYGVKVASSSVTKSLEETFD